MKDRTMCSWYYTVIWTFSVLSMSQGQTPFQKPCEGYPQSEIYCYGDFLHTVQLAKLFPDQKTFVDCPLKYEPDVVLQSFKQLNISGENLTPEEKLRLGEFLKDNFYENGTEFEAWDPSDWQENPSFLNGISNTELKSFAKELNSLWKLLGRKIKLDVKENRSKHSMYYVSHPVIVPGGRFKEFYYWDSYWIQRGLLVSEMKDTVKGMVQNFLEMVGELGFIPNGGRIYYQRSQPPLLIPMVDGYYEATKDVNFLRENLKVLMREFNFFMVNRTVRVSYNNKEYTMARFNVELTAPRPESYSEDFELVDPLPLTTTEEDVMYASLKTGAESGWDFSSRWYVMENNDSLIDGNLTNTKARDIIPVDLNSFLYHNAVLLEKFCTLVNDSSLCDPDTYRNISLSWKTAIQDVLWDEESGAWFDYDFVRGKKRKYFFPTNLTPLWVNAYHGDIEVIAKRAVNYLHSSGATNFPGGIPTSMLQTGLQWDFPNGWAPLNHIIIEALENTNVPSAQNLAFELAQKWVRSNHIGYLKKEAMFEKYDVSVPGEPGGGGEYEVVLGFGWTNGVALDLMNKYGSRLTPAENLPYQK